MATEIDDGLTDEERAALADEGAEGAAQDEDEGDDAADDEGEGADDAGAGDDDGAAGDDADSDAAAAEGDGADAAAANTEQPAGPAPESAPILVAQPPEDADAKLAEIATAKDALLTKFDDGDITAREYQLELDKLAKQEREIEWGVEKAKLAGEMEQQRQANEWKSTVDGFIAENSRYNPTTSPRMYQLLDMEVRAVATSDEFKNRSDAAAGRAILQRAHENLAKELGFEAKPKGKTPPPPKKDLPPSLHSAPAADVNDTGGGKFAVLDRLASTDPIAYEESLMKLSEREREAYLNA